MYFLSESDLVYLHMLVFDYDLLCHEAELE